VFFDAICAFGFGGMSPEKKAGVALKKLFTFCAAK